MTITTRLTQRFKLKHPIVLAPMTVSGGALAAAVSEAGGLGLLGGSYINRPLLESESAKGRRPDLGCGFITWSLAEDPELLDLALDRFPRAMMLSFSDPAPYAPRIKQAGVPLICQVHTLEHALHAVDVGADVVVAQGTEAGGHGFTVQSTLPFVPAVVDALAKRAPDVLVLAAGGIADGRGLAAALMLGADGVLMGTRFYMTQEAMIADAAKTKALTKVGADTVRTSVYDVVLNREWPAGYVPRVVRGDFVEKWHGHEDELRRVREAEFAKLEHAIATDDYDIANLTVGEGVGLVHDVPKASDVVDRTIAEAEALFKKFAPGLAAKSAPTGEGLVSEMPRRIAS